MNRVLPVFAGLSTVYSGVLTYMLYDTKEKLNKKEDKFNTQLSQLQSTVRLLKEDYDKEHKPFEAKDLIVPAVGAALCGVFYYLK